MLEKLMNNPYAWLFLSALSIFSVIFGIWTWCAGKQRKEISFDCRSDILIKAGKQQIKKLDVFYNGNSIADLTSSKFYIWNSGNQVLQRDDIVTARPIAIRSEKAKMLDAQILRMSDPTSAFQINAVSEQEINVDFEYMESGDGVLIQILHTGDFLDLDFDCKIKGGNDVRDCTKEHKNRKILLRDKILDFIATEFATLFFLLFLGLGLGFVMVFLKDMQFTTINFVSCLTLVLVCFLIGLSLSKSISNFANKMFNRSIPKALLTDNRKGAN